MVEDDEAGSDDDTGGAKRRRGVGAPKAKAATKGKPSSGSGVASVLTAATL